MVKQELEQEMLAREQLGQLHARLRAALAHPVLLDSLGGAGAPVGRAPPAASCDLGRLFRAGPPRSAAIAPS